MVAVFQDSFYSSVHFRSAAQLNSNLLETWVGIILEQWIFTGLEIRLIWYLYFDNLMHLKMQFIVLYSWITM